MSTPDQSFFKGDTKDQSRVDLIKKYFSNFSPLKSLVDMVYGKDFLSTTMAVALEKPEAREALVRESLAQIKKSLGEINNFLTSQPGLPLKELIVTHKESFDRVCAALAVVGTLIHQAVSFPEISGVRFDEDIRRFVLGLGSNSGGERIFISFDRQTKKLESFLSFPGQDTTNCRILQSGFRKLFPVQVKRRTREGAVVEDPSETKAGDLFLEF